MRPSTLSAPKYNGIPGDLVYTQASAFGLVIPAAGITSGGGTGLGDGNGQIQDTAATNTNTPIGEPLIFWQHLSTASLIDGSLGTNLSGTNGGVGSSPTPGQYLPLAKLGRGNYWAVGSDSGTTIMCWAT